MAGPARFPKARRLLERADFLAVQGSALRVADPSFLMCWRARPADDKTHARVGITASRKLGPAVVRNRIKRRLREAVRHEWERMPPVDLVLIARPGAATVPFPALRAALARALARLPAPESP